MTAYYLLSFSFRSPGPVRSPRIPVVAAVIGGKYFDNIGYSSSRLSVMVIWSALDTSLIFVFLFTVKHESRSRMAATTSGCQGS